MLHWKFHGGKLCEALLLTFLFAFKHDSNLLKARRVEGRCDACKGIAKWCKDNEHESVVCVSFLHLQKQWTGKSALGKGKASAIHEFLGSIRFHSHSSWHEGVTICWTEAVKLNAMRCHEAMTNWQVTICEKQLSWTRLPPKWSVDVYRQLGGGLYIKQTSWHVQNHGEWPWIEVLIASSSKHSDSPCVFIISPPEEGVASYACAVTETVLKQAQRWCLHETTAYVCIIA